MTRPPLSGERIVANLSADRRLGTSIEIHQEIASTNDRCHEASPSVGEGLVVFAEHQSSGRGQYGRTWTAPPRSSLLFSVLLDPPSALDAPRFLIAWSAVAVAETIHEEFGLLPEIKWPNDLLIEGRKVAGILVERRRRTVVGIGLNVDVRVEEFPSEPRWPPTSLASASGAPIDRNLLASALLRRMDELYREAREKGPRTVIDRWRPFGGSLVGKVVRAATHEKTIVGTLTLLDPDRGAGLVDSEGNMTYLSPERLLRLEGA